MYQPLTPEMHQSLRQFEIDARRQLLSPLVGGHVSRRMGQSLEFQEYTAYQRGDDIRHVDWRVSERSQRHDSYQDWIVRRFAAEKTLQVLISIDTRQTMTLPEMEPKRFARETSNISKLQVAMWIAEAVAHLVLENNDRVIIHQLFGSMPKTAILERRRSQAVLVHELEVVTGDAWRLMDNSNRDDLAALLNDEMLDENTIRRYLPPAGVWIILTDLYFGAQGQQQLIDRVSHLSARNRWVILIELDSWPYERERLTKGMNRLIWPQQDAKRVSGQKAVLDHVETRINANRQDFYRACTQVKPTIWPWPPEVKKDGLHQFFLNHLNNKNNNDELVKLFAGVS